MGIFGTFTLMRRAMGWFGLAFMVWAMAGVGIHYFWNSTSAKRSLAERVAAGEALERWVLTESEYAELGVVDGEFWLEDRVYDVMNTERLEGGLVALQVFDDSYESELAKLGRKLLRRQLEDSNEPPTGLGQWVTLHAVVPHGLEVLVSAPIERETPATMMAEGQEKKRNIAVYSPPEQGAHAA